MKKIAAFILLFVSVYLSAQVPGYTTTINSGSPGGYYFVSPFKFGVSNSSYNIILDSTGNVVYYSYFPTVTAEGLKIQPNGLMSYFYNNQFLLMDSTFTVVKRIAAQNGYTTDEHELLILPNGHYMLLALEYVTMDLSSYHYFNDDSAPGSSTALVTCPIIQELDSTGQNVVFEWHAKDYLSFDGVDNFFLDDSATVDWMHSNALEMDYDGNILMSSRHFDQIIKINRTDSSVMWRLGGKYNEFTFIGDTTPFYGQHDIRRLSNGHITLFDDGNHFIPHGARAMEYELNDTNYTAQAVWSYTYDSSMYVYAMGNVERLQNSNTFINYGDILSNNVCFNVVDSNGTQLFKLAFTDTLSSYRAFNYPQLPWSLHRPQLSCFDSVGVTYLDAGAGYGSYRWSNGSSTQTIPVTSADTFYVFVPYGQGGFISSDKIIVTDIKDVCSATSVTEVPLEKDVTIFPNPATSQLFISTSGIQPEWISVYDVNGRSVSEQKFVPQIDIASLSPGVYFLALQSANTTIRRMFVKD